MISNRKKIFSHIATLDIASRAMSSVLTIGVLLLLALYMPLPEFAMLQLAYVLAGIAVWLGDMGMTNLLINYHAIRRSQQVVEVWYQRLFGIILSSTLTLVLCTLIVDNFVVIFYAIAIFEILGNSNLSFRQVSSTKRFALLVQPIRGLLQLSGLMLISAFEGEFSHLTLFWILSTPALLVIIWDLKQIGKPSFRHYQYHWTASWKYFLQSGGNMLISFDYIMLNQLGYLNWIAIMAVPKRFVNAVYSLALSFAPRVQYEIYATGAISHQTLKKIRVTALSSGVILCALGTLVSLPLDFFPDSFQTREHIYLAFVVLSTGFVQIMNAYLNTILLGFRKLRHASYANYFGVGCYLLALYFLPSIIDQIWLSIAMSLIIGFGLTYVLNFYFVRKLNVRF